VLALFLRRQSFAANNPLISLYLQFHALFSQNLVAISLSTISAIFQQQSGTCEHIPKIDENHEAYLHDEAFRIAETDWSRNTNASESVSQPILDCNGPGATNCLGAFVPHVECSHNYCTFNNIISIS
jgi:hypothetical protein